MNRQDRDPRQEKTFAALPPAPGRGFASTWWGHAWLRALEDSALDGEQVRQGRRYARAGAVGAVSVRPGGLTAVVRDRDGTAHRTDVLVQEFSPAQWDRLLGLAAAESGHIAALLDREVPPELAEDAAAAGVELLPGIGDLDPRCDCGEWDHCPHTAALCYQVARLLDQDAFVLMLLRGRGERELVAELGERSTAGAAADREPVAEGVPAAEVYAAWGGSPVPVALPDLPRLPDAPGQPPSLDTEAGTGTGAGSGPELDVDAVEFLAQAAATQAHRLLARALAPGHAGHLPPAPYPVPGRAAYLPGPPYPAYPPYPPYSVAEDAVRLAAEATEPRIRSRLAAATGRDRAAMELAVRAWGFGGAPALAALEDDWTPDRDTLARARAALAGARADGSAADGGAPALRRVRARWTEPGGERQLRLGREGRWWPYRREAGRWVPAGPSAADPATALTAPDTA